MNRGFNANLFIRGDTDSFEYIVNCYEKRIFGFIYNMIRNKTIVEDLTQDVFVKVYQNCYRYNPEFPIEPWLFKIAYNTTLNYMKKNKRKHKEVAIEEELNYTPSLDNQIDRFEMRHILVNEIELLKPETKAILILRILHELTFEQIAAMLGTSAASVKLKYYRSRKVIIENLSENLKGV